jgi:hypothetical protein
MIAELVNVVIAAAAHTVSSPRNRAPSVWFLDQCLRKQHGNEPGSLQRLGGSASQQAAGTLFLLSSWLSVPCGMPVRRLPRNDEERTKGRRMMTGRILDGLNDPVLIAEIDRRSRVVDLSQSNWDRPARSFSPR